MIHGEISAVLYRLLHRILKTHWKEASLRHVQWLILVPVAEIHVLDRILLKNIEIFSPENADVLLNLFIK